MTTGRSDLVDLELILLCETPRAYLVEGDFGKAWLPKSQVERDGYVFTMPRWLAEEKELV